MDQQDLHAFEARCVQEEPPACQTMCPLHVDARSFARLMAEKKVKEARKILDRAMPLASLTGHLCHGACLPHCIRGKVDAPVQMPLLEKACLLATQNSKPMPMPATGKQIAVIGSGLSGLCLAWELGKKGHLVTIFTHGAQGGALSKLSPDQLPAGVLNAAYAQLAAVRVTFSSLPETGSPDWLRSLTDYQAVYLGFDDPALPKDITNGFLEEPVLRNPLTLETSLPHIFAGGLTDSAFIASAADGRRAAGSIERLFQGVAPSAAREKEATYPTALYTDVSEVQADPCVQPENPAAPSVDEAVAEAARCIQCQCLECVKQCPYLAHYKGYPKKYAREVYNNLSVVQGLRQANKLINSCAECGLCAAICPHQADMGAFCAEARKGMVAANRMPPSAHEFALEDMEYSNAPDVAFLRHQPGHTASAYLFFPGCQLPASLPTQTQAVYSHLCDHLTGGVGFLLRCCGAPAKWSGRPQLTATVAAEITAKWEASGKPTIITACASCLLFFQQELPEIPVVSLWALLTKMPLPGSAAAWTDTQIALHDPCASRHDQHTCASVRHILGQLQQQVEEMPLHGETTRCCGYGGLASAANQDVAALFAKVRAEDTASPLVSYCIMCRDRIRATGKESLHLLDLLFPSTLPNHAVLRPSPGISERQTGRLAFRHQILSSLWDELAAKSETPYTLHIPNDLAANLERRHILHSDIEQVLRYAKAHGPLFTHQETGKSLAALRPRQVTIWVEYTQRPDGSYSIFDAYSHRMVVPGVPGEGRSSPCTLEGYAAKGGRL